MKTVVASSFYYFVAELKENVRKLEEWLKETEHVLRQPLKFNQKWSKEAIDEKMLEIQVRTVPSVLH